MSEPLVLVGSGGFAREAAHAVLALNAQTPRWHLLGYLDDDPATHGRVIDGLSVLGPVEAAIELDARVVVCTGNPHNWWSRLDIVRRLDLNTDRYATVVHPSASLALGTEPGPGTVVLASAVSTTAVEIGAHVAVMPGVILTHDDEVGDHATIASGVRLGGGVTVERGAYLGAGALVREGLTVGAWSQVGMGSLVLQSVPSGEVWAGSPARHLRPAAVPPSLLPDRALARSGHATSEPTS